MAEKTRTKVIDLAKGFATDLAPEERDITYNVRAENIIFEASRAVRKCGGGTRLNSTALSGAPSTLGQFDYYKAGTAGSFTQVYVVTTSDSKVYCEESPSGSPGVFTDRTGALSIGASAIPVFVQAKDVLTIWFSDASAPATYNNTGAAAALSGTPPAARCACWHGNRMWAGGTNANPSRLYYSAYGSATVWSGEDTGALDIDSEDGDRIVGLVSHKNALIIFKGPNKGSIWMITGSTPEGDDGFSEQIIVRGIPLQTHNSIVHVGDDVWFMSDRAIHSLSAVARYGDFEEEAITKYLFGYFRDTVSRTRLSSVWAANDAQRGAVFFALTNVAGSTNNEALGISYIRPDEGLKPFTWTLASCQSIGLRTNPTTKLRELIFGDNAGFLVRMNQATRIMPATTAYTGHLTTPAIIMDAQDSQGAPRIDQPVSLESLWLRRASVGNYDVSVSLARDEKAAQTFTFNQGASGFLLGTSILGTDSMGGQPVLSGGVRAEGRARTVTVDITQSGPSQDMNLYELGLEYTPIAQDRSQPLQ